MLAFTLAFTRLYGDDPEFDGWLYVLAAMGSLWVATTNWKQKPAADQSVT
jgi:hypothetical protein